MYKDRGVMTARNDMHTRALLASTSRGQDTIPNQAIANTRKNKKFYEDTLEALEGIGLRQIQDNLQFNDIYAMLDGELVVTNFITNSHLLNKIGSLYKKEDFDIPDYVKPFDLLSRVVRYQSTKYTEINHRFNVDFLDPISENEIDREFNNRLMQSALELFEVEKQIREVQWNILPPDTQFETEEEQQQYLQELEERKKLISTPQDIKHSIQREWKPLAVKWVNKTIERDKRRFNYKRLYQKYYTDFYSTGRYFNHINIHKMGVYTQERWCPIYTFFSQEYDIEFPQYCSYVGHIDTIGKDQLVTDHGQSIRNSDLQKLINYGTGDIKTETTLTSPNTYKDILAGDVVEGLPRDYYQREAYVALEGELGLPLSTEYYFNMDGELDQMPAYTMSYKGNSQGGTRQLFRKNTRRDINVEDDIYLRTRVYWTSYERVGYLYYDDDGSTRRVFITEDILPEVLEKYNAKVKRTLTIRELDELERKGNIESGTLCYTQIPRTYYGVLIRTKGLGLDKDLILDVGKMDLQIKGDDENIYQCLKPVTGIITTPEINRLIPYQIEYTYNINLARKYSENELGMLFLMDINFLNSEHSSSTDAGGKFTQFLSDVRDGMVIPVDGSRRNLREGQGVPMNPMGIYELTNTNIIRAKKAEAEDYKRLLLEEAGLSQQLLSEPQKYVTAEGVKTSDSATQTILDYNFDRMDEAYLKDLEVLIRIAQYYEGEKDKVTLSHTRDDGELELISFVDKFIGLRKFNLISLEDSDKRRKREEVKNYILSNNTFEDETETLISLITSDSYTTMMSELKGMEAKRQDLRAAAEAREDQANQERNQALIEAEKIAAEAKDKEYQVRIREAIIAAVSRMNSRSQTPSNNNSEITKLYEEELKNLRESDRLGLEYDKLNAKVNSDMSEMEYKQRKLMLEEQRAEREERRLDIREKERQSNNFKKVISNR